MAFKKKLKRQHFSSRQKNMLEIPKFITKQKRKNQILPNSTPYFYLYFSRRLQKSINGGRNSKNTQHPIRPVITNQSPSTSISLSLSLLKFLNLPFPYPLSPSAIFVVVQLVCWIGSEISQKKRITRTRFYGTWIPVILLCPKASPIFLIRFSKFFSLSFSFL